MARNVLLQPSSVTVLRSSEYLALLAGAENYFAAPQSKLSILPDTATVGDIIAAINAWSPQPGLPPTA